MTRELLTAFKVTSAPLALGIAMISVPSYAQDAQAVETADADAIVVTGTRITRQDLEAASPVSVVTSEQLQLRNKPGVEEFLRNLPQAVPAQGRNTNNGNEGVATVNLRNLGEERTLVLVDGRRFVPYDSQGIVDLNMIPAALIERVEVVTGGASAVYGSDAIAGVVNFIMKKNFTGIEGDAQYGVSEKGDGRHYDFSLTGGINLGDRGNIVVNGTYSKQDKVTQGARRFSETSLSAAALAADGGSSTNLFGSVDTGLEPDSRFTFTPAGFLPYDAARDAFNFNPYNLLQVPHEKWTATALARYELTDSIEFFARGSYGQTKVRTEVAPSGTFGFSFDINYLTNPFLDPAQNPSAAGARQVLARLDTGPDVNGEGDAVANDGIVTVGVRRRTTEVGPRIDAFNNKAWQVVGGLRGDLGSSLKWEVFAQYGKSHRKHDYLNDLDANRVQQALLVSGTTIANAACIDPSNGCAPANLFGRDNLSASAARFIAFNLFKEDKNDQLVAGGFVSGDLPLELVSSRPAAFVLGVEYRKETATANPDINLRTGNSIGFGSETPLEAQLNVKEVYGELKVPLVADVPFIHSLGLEAGFRYSMYKNSTSVDSTATGGTIANFRNSFNNWTFKIGGDWEPFESLRIRGMFQRAVRAPNLFEIGTPSTAGTGDALFDPCDSTVFPAVGDATLAQLCNTVGGGLGIDSETGLPRAPGSIAPPTAGQVNNFTGGNPNLEPEVANTFTIGAVFRPPSIRGLSASVDYFDIKVKKAILETPEQAILDACYFAERNANGTFCPFITRSNIDGTLEGDPQFGVESLNRNIGQLRARGFDFALDYNSRLNDDLRLLFSANATWVLDSHVQYADVLRVYECAGKVGKTCLAPQPKWAWNVTGGVEAGPALVQLTWRHIGAVEFDAFTVGYFNPPRSFVAVPVIPSHDYFDLAVRFKIEDRFQLRFGVDNLFNKQPPIVGNDYGGTTENSGNTFPATYDPLGRYFSAGLNLKF